MNHLAYFWVAAGFMAGIAAAFFVLRLWSVSCIAAVSTPRNKILVVLAAAVFSGIAFSIYAWVGKPGLANQTSIISNHATAVAAQTDAGPGSMMAAVNKLVAKISDGGGTDADWQLLQQSYEFIGDAEGVALAQQHKLKTNLAVQPASAALAAPASADPDALLSYQQRVTKNPEDASAWLAIAQLQRTARNFADAAAAFEQAIKLKAMNADAWADYADAAASVTDSLGNDRTRVAIEAAVKLKPQHSKALWLKASLAHEEHRYADALKVWQQLRAAIPDGSPDIGIIDANIQEARSLAGNAGTDSVVQSGSVIKVQVRGNVVLDPALKQSDMAGMTLFVYAKSADSAAPVAAYKTSVKSWPVSFVLDDTLAMMPGRKLSQFEQVRVEARLSRSGQALAQAGDLQSEPVMVVTRDAQPVSLRLSRLVP